MRERALGILNYYQREMIWISPSGVTFCEADLASLAKRLEDWIPAVSKPLVGRGVGLMYTHFPL